MSQKIGLIGLGAMGEVIATHLLNKSFVTISFSSTVIEDSLYSNVPVILFDRWGRYKHCRAEVNVKSKN